MKHMSQITIGLITASLFIGCGGGGSSTSTSTTTTGNTGSTNATPPPASNNSKMFTADVMPILNTKCKSCHGTNGRFSISTPSGTYANISDLKASVTMAGQYLLDKSSNTIGHGGGMVIGTSTMEYATIKSWVNAGADFN